MRAIGVVFLWSLMFVSAIQASPTLLNPNLQLRLVLNTPTTSQSVRIAKDPRNNQLYYLQVNGDIYQVNLTNSTSARVYSSADHGLSSSVEGMAIGPDGTMYILANLTSGDYSYVKIMKGVPNSSGVRVWSLLAKTDLWQRSETQFDHDCSTLLVSSDGQFLYYNAGARTDHGEVEDAGGIFPNTRDVPLTAKVFQVPLNGSQIFLTNDLPTLLSEGYVYAQGTRNAFDFAYAPNGDLFATDNGPDRDMPDSLYWLRQGAHYGFPWRMGGMDNPQQFPNYNPTNDLLLNPAFYAISSGRYHNDPTFPPPPTNFTDPVINLGPDADSYRSPTNGLIYNASAQGLPLQSFTAHRAPMGLVFDTIGALAPPFQYHGFVLGWTPGDPTGDTVAGPFDDPGQDMSDMDLTKLGNTNYEMRVTRIVGGFSEPIDAEIISNKVYVIEYGGNQGLWEITFPAVNQQYAAVHVEGDLIVNLQSSDLIAGSSVWTNRTSSANSAGSFSTVNGHGLNVTNLTWNSQSISALSVTNQLGNAVQSVGLAPAEIIGNNPVSAEAWIYATAVNQQNSCAVSYGLQGGSSAPEKDREFNYSEPCCGGGVSGDFGSYDTQWGTTPTPGAWHYLAWTYDGSTVRLYLDGQLNATNSPGSPLQTPATVMGVGAGIANSGPNLGADTFQGYIAAARVESGVLTAQDIQTNYALGPLGTAGAIPPTGLAAVSGDGQVALSWNVSGNASSYNVKRAASSNGVYTVIATNVTTLGFTNTGLADGTIYYFAVSAVNSAGESANSAAVGAQPTSLTPPLFSFATSAGEMQIGWPPDHTGWILQAQTNSLTGTNWVTVPGSTLTNQIEFLINAANGSIFFRLVYPQF